MCKAFSCLVTKTGKVYWQLGLDGHEWIRCLFKHEKDLADDCDSKRFIRIEVAPKNDNYLYPDKWVLKIDEVSTPDWFSPKHRALCMEAQQDWYRQIEEQIKLEEARDPVHPFEIKSPEKITEEHLKLLHEWVSVWASVWDSVRVSVWGSLEESVWAYAGSLFPKITDWKYVKTKIKGYPFQSAVDLWRLGLVPSFDGKTWRLHGGKDAKVLWQGKLEK